MPKRRPSRRARRGRTPTAPPFPASSPTPAPPGSSKPPEAPRPARPVAPVLPMATSRAEARERSVTRFTARDYTYVRREIQRIVILATAIVIAIIVISFFLP